MSGKLIFSLLVFLVRAAFPLDAFAGISVAPGIIEIIAARGDEATGSCEVTNTGTQKASISVSPEDWRKGFRGKRGESVAEWLSVTPQTLELEAGKSGKFTYQVKVAGDATGEYTAQLFFSETGGGETQIQTRVGAVLYVAVRETLRLESEITDFRLSVSRDGDASIANAQVKVANSGNVHIRPTGEVKIFGPDGAFVMAAILNTGWGILPGEDYTYQGTGRGPALKPGKYKAVAAIQSGKLYKQDKTYTKDLFFEIDAEGRIVGEVKSP